MSEFRRYPKSTTRTIIDYNRVISQADEYGIFCINKGVMSILRKLVRQRGMWPTSYSLGFDISGYWIPDPEEFEPIDNLISEFLGGEDMCNDLTLALQAIAAGSVGGCCDNGSGGQSPDEPFLPFTDTGTNFPEGFPDRPAYDEHKCNAAQYYINNWQQDIAYLQALPIAGGVVAGALAAFLFVPGVNVIGLAGVLTLTIALGLFSNDLTAIADWLDTENDNLRCILYSGLDSNATYDAMVAYIEASSLTVQQQIIAKYFVTSAAINDMYQLSNVPDLGAICLCDCTGYTVTIGTDLGSESAISEFSSTDNRHWVQVVWDCPISLDSLNANQTLTTPSNNAYRLYDELDNIIYSSNTPPTLPIADVAYMTLVKIPQAGAFTINWSASQ